MGNLRLLTLASHAAQVHRQMATHIARLQSGFLPSKSLHEVQEMTTQFQETLREMQDALAHPSAPSPPRSFIPLK